MPKTYKILVPEYVPLENKGEEAIIRGYEDVLFPEGNAEFTILDMKASRPYDRDGFHVLPGLWFYSKWRSQEFRPGIKPSEIYSTFFSLLRHGLNRFYPKWIRRPQGPVLKIKKAFERIRAGKMQGISRWASTMVKLSDYDYVLAGHDGGFNEYDCHIMDMMKAHGIPHGVFGTAMKIKTTSPVILDIFRNTLSNSDSIICRNAIAQRWAHSKFPEMIERIELAPDPAFGMKPAAPKRADEIVAAEGLEEFFMKPVVMVTTAEPSPVARNSFGGKGTREQRLTRHRELLAKLLKHVVETHDVNVLILPHAIGPGEFLDDRMVGREVMSHLPELSGSRIKLMETEYGARDLKALIGKAEFVIGERVHSLIGSVGVQTPFIAVGVREDYRIEGILGEMCEMADWIYYINEPDEGELKAHFDKAYEKRADIRKHLKAVYTRLSKRLAEVGAEVRSHIIEPKA